MTSRDDLPDNINSSWRDCQDGEIGKVSATLKRRRRVHTIRRQGVVALVLFAVVGLGWYTYSMNQPGGHLVAGVYCSEVCDASEELFTGQVDPKRTSKIKRHLDDCSPCVDRLAEARKEYEQRTGKKAKFQYSPEPDVALRPLELRAVSLLTQR